MMYIIHELPSAQGTSYFMNNVLLFLCPGGEKQCRQAAPRFVAAGMIDRALHVCQEFLNSLEHGDIDITMETRTSLMGQQWAEFLHDYYLVVQ